MGTRDEEHTVVVSTDMVMAYRISKSMVREMAMALDEQKRKWIVLLEVAMDVLLGAIEDNLAKAFETASASVVLGRK